MEQRLPDAGLLRRRQLGVPVMVGDVEGVDGALAITVDMRRGNIQPGLGDGADEVGQQARPVAARHLDHRGVAAGLVVERHGRPNFALPSFGRR